MQSEDQNSLYRVVKDYIPAKKIARYNKLKKWSYGYNKDYDVVIISNNGTIGDIICISGLYIALPSAPDKVNSRSKKNK